MPPLLSGLLGGAIIFAVLLVAAITHLGLLYQFQTLLSGMLAIGASLIVLFGVYARISHDRRIEEEKIKRDAFAFATALLTQVQEIERDLWVIYSICISHAEEGNYQLALNCLYEGMKKVKIPPLFDASWRDFGLLNPEITLWTPLMKGGLQLAIDMGTSNRWTENQPSIPGLSNPFDVIFDKADKNNSEKEIEDFLREQITYYENMIRNPLANLVSYLETEAEEYAIQLGLDKKQKWLKTQAKERRDARGHSGND